MQAANLPMAVLQAAASSAAGLARAVSKTLTLYPEPKRSPSYEACASVDGDPEAEPQALIVHLLSATRLPRLVKLNRSSISPYVIMWVIDHRGEVVGEQIMWAPRPATRDPVWNSAHDLRLPRMAYKDLKRSLLHVELWDHHPVLPPNPIGQVPSHQLGHRISLANAPPHQLGHHRRRSRRSPSSPAHPRVLHTRLRPRRPCSRQRDVPHPSLRLAI